MSGALPECDHDDGSKRDSDSPPASPSFEGYRTDSILRLVPPQQRVGNSDSPPASPCPSFEGYRTDSILRLVPPQQQVNSSKFRQDSPSPSPPSSVEGYKLDSILLVKTLNERREEKHTNNEDDDGLEHDDRRESEQEQKEERVDKIVSEKEKENKHKAVEERGKDDDNDIIDNNDISDTGDTDDTDDTEDNNDIGDNDDTDDNNEKVTNDGNDDDGALGGEKSYGVDWKKNDKGSPQHTVTEQERLLEAKSLETYVVHKGHDKGLAFAVLKIPHDGIALCGTAWISTLCGTARVCGGTIMPTTPPILFQSSFHLPLLVYDCREEDAANKSEEEEERSRIVQHSLERPIGDSNSGEELQRSFNHDDKGILTDIQGHGHVDAGKHMKTRPSLRSWYAQHGVKIAAGSTLLFITEVDRISTAPPLCPDLPVTHIRVPESKQKLPFFKPISYLKLHHSRHGFNVRVPKFIKQNGGCPERLLIVGAANSGKSTLGRTIVNYHVTTAMMKSAKSQRKKTFATDMDTMMTNDDLLSNGGGVVHHDQFMNGHMNLKISEKDNDYEEEKDDDDDDILMKMMSSSISSSDMLSLRKQHQNYLINNNNRNNNRFEYNEGGRAALIYVDVDVGQPDRSIAGLVSAHIVTEPCTSRSSGCRSVPFCARFFGEVTPRDNPDYYGACVRDVIDTALATARAHNLPMLVNSHGWMTGRGELLTGALCHLVQPTCIARMRGGTSIRTAMAADEALDRILGFSHQPWHVVDVEGRPAHTLFDRYKPSAAAQRDLVMCAYFAQNIATGTVRRIRVRDVRIVVVGGDGDIGNGGSGVEVKLSTDVGNKIQENNRDQSWWGGWVGNGKKERRTDDNDDDDNGDICEVDDYIDDDEFGGTTVPPQALVTATVALAVDEGDEEQYYYNYNMDMNTGMRGSNACGARLNVKGMGVVRGVDKHGIWLYIATPLPMDRLQQCDVVMVGVGIHTARALLEQGGMHYLHASMRNKDEKGDGESGHNLSGLPCWMPGAVDSGIKMRNRKSCRRDGVRYR